MTLNKPLLLSVGIALTVFALLLTTSSVLPMAWDEGNAIDRASDIRAWAGTLAERGTAAFSDAEIAHHWHYTVEIEGHPALYGIAIAFGQWLGGTWLAPLTAARLGPMLLFGAAAGAMFYRLARQYSLVAALGGVAALVTMPRLFSHAHFASFDGPLTSCWMLAWVLFPSVEIHSGARGTPQRAFPTEALGTSGPRLRCGLVWAAVWGMAMGATMSCKFTGWLAPLPFVGYALVYGDRKTARTLGIGLAAALATFWLVNPRMWYHPIGGVESFLDLNLKRAGTAFDIPTLFFGTRYTQASGLPWYNTLVWTGVTVPVGTLLLSGIGIVGVLRRWAIDGQGTLILANWLVLVVVRALPGAPVHDAERLILPSFAFLAALAGVGCHFLSERHAARCVQNGAPSVARRVVLGSIVAIYLGSASSLLWYAPQWLSYYNLLIGGLRGADAAGMEATYYWDALDHEVLNWLHEHTALDEKVHVAAASPLNLALMQRWGVLQRGWRPEEPGKYRWYVIGRRPTFWSDRDRWLVEHEMPAFNKTIRPPTWGIGPWRLDVPLIEIFSYDQYRGSQDFAVEIVLAAVRR